MKHQKNLYENSRRISRGENVLLSSTNFRVKNAGDKVITVT
jgi:hypothetical protein